MTPRLRCQTCLFWKRLSTQGIYGHCHRYPPSMLALELQPEREDIPAFPIVHEDEWCGEWKEAR